MNQLNCFQFAALQRNKDLTRLLVPPHHFVFFAFPSSISQFSNTAQSVLPHSLCHYHPQLKTLHINETHSTTDFQTSQHPSAMTRVALFVAILCLFATAVLAKTKHQKMFEDLYVKSEADLLRDDFIGVYVCLCLLSPTQPQ